MRMSPLLASGGGLRRANSAAGSNSHFRFAAVAVDQRTSRNFRWGRI
jgi:hypothetical protein